MKSKTILCLMDYGKDCKTGFGTVSKNIKSEIKRHYKDDINLHILAVNHYGENYTEEDGTIVFSAKINDVKQDDFGRYAFIKILQDSDEYDGIFIMQDLGVISPIMPIIQHIKEKKIAENRKQFKSIFYFPVDCNLFASLTRNLEVFDLIVTYTEFARAEVLKFRPDLKGKVKVVYHGNNPKDFYEVDKDKALAFRKEFFGENADKFIIINANRNQPRKDLPTTIFAFIELKKTWDVKTFGKEPFLYIHAHPKDPLGHDLRALLMQTELVEDEDYMLLPKRLEGQMATTEELNLIYNACDLYVTTTLGEGWGLTITESMAVGLPIIAPNTTSITEISGNGTRLNLLNTIIPICSSLDNIIREQCDYLEVAEMIIDVATYYGWGTSNKQKDKITKGKEFVASITWKQICKRWIGYFGEVY